MKAIYRVKGFTLIELVITIAIIAILAAVAIPAYTKFVEKSRRADGVSALTILSLEQQKLRSSCPWFAGALSATVTACNATSVLSTVNIANESDEGFYAISITSSDSFGFVALATAQNEQASDTCGNITYTLTNASPQGVITYATASCN